MVDGFCFDIMMISQSCICIWKKVSRCTPFVVRDGVRVSVGTPARRMYFGVPYASTHLRKKKRRFGRVQRYLQASVLLILLRPLLVQVGQHFSNQKDDKGKQTGSLIAELILFFFAVQDGTIM